MRVECPICGKKLSMRDPKNECDVVLCNACETFVAAAYNNNKRLIVKSVDDNSDIINKLKVTFPAIRFDGHIVKFDYVGREIMETQCVGLPQTWELYRPNSLSGVFTIDGKIEAYGNILSNKRDKCVDIIGLESIFKKIGTGTLVVKYLAKYAKQSGFKKLRGLCYLYDAKVFWSKMVAHWSTWTDAGQQFSIKI